jgi:peptidoglycan/xylan/chitin deacetylase (PgdA/CDA1 family)
MRVTLRHVRPLLVPIFATVALALHAPEARGAARPRVRPPQAGAANQAARVPNELGRIPILEYHLVGGPDGMWRRSASAFRADLELLYARGYLPVSVADLVARRLDLPAGRSPVVITFDDASPSQFRYLVRDGRRVIDDTSAVGIWRAMQRAHPEWGSRATFCLLPAAREGHAFFGDRGIEGQETSWRFEKLAWLAAQGFELCAHTLWHANLRRYDDAVVQEQIARSVLAIDSAVPGYAVRTFALPLGAWPRNRDLARAGAWTDRRSNQVTRYAFSAILEVAGGAVPSPHDPAFDPLRLKRTIVTGDALERLLDHLDASGTRYVSDGDARTVARLPVIAAAEKPRRRVEERRARIGARAAR